ncbi:hypothetical protein [Natronobacterium texcoconense]|uniref:Uncharacterized protein n=1 Tax=Natronobacterium texcoconense TaxID=1095778 RepID=A0A1H1EVI4_NATTX|nr:hypothetical protein [Natronobacterium texcoconense]SDQ92549.1 hypothetical protein SAMN04489842_1710 [Natronobacterium texcoconense]
MRRSLRYALATIVAGSITFGVSLVHDSPLLLVGTFVTYAMTATLWLRYPALLQLRPDRRDGFDAVGAVIAGGTTFGIMSFAQSLADPIHLGAAVMGLGLVFLGTGYGILLVEAGDVPLESLDVPASNTDGNATRRSE